MVIFIGDGMLFLLAIVILLAGGYSVGAKIADFLVNFGIIVPIIMIIISVFLSLMAYEYDTKGQKLVSVIGFSLTDIIKAIFFYVFMMAWAYDYAYFSSGINAIISLFIMPFCLTVASAICVTPTVVLRDRISKNDTSYSVIPVVLTLLLDVILAVVFAFIVRFLISECFFESYNRMLSNGWWENILHLAK